MPRRRNGCALTPVTCSTLQRIRVTATGPRPRELRRAEAWQTTSGQQHLTLTMAAPSHQPAACCPDSPRNKRRIYRRHSELQDTSGDHNTFISSYMAGHTLIWCTVQKDISAHVSDQLIVVDLAIRSASNVPRRHHLQEHQTATCATKSPMCSPAAMHASRHA